MTFLEELAARRRFGMRPGLEVIRGVCAALGNPERRLGKVIHIAGTNGKGAVAALLDSCLRSAEVGRVGRYTSPHLVRLNERFFLDGRPIGDAALERQSERVSSALRHGSSSPTFFEALTAVAFLIYAEAQTDYVLLETGLGGRLDATNVCSPTLAVITRIGLDHCDWLGGTVEEIAAEKGGIIKPGVPVLLAENVSAVRAVIERIAAERGAPFCYAPDLAAAAELPRTLSLAGSFNRENAVTALAALKLLLRGDAGRFAKALDGFGKAVWPGRFQLAAGVLVDGAHNPPAAAALVSALAERYPQAKFPLVAGFCGDKDVVETLRVLRPLVPRGYAVQTNNPRSLTAAQTAEKMHAAGIEAEPCDSLAAALAAVPPRTEDLPRALVCGSLFLAGEAIVELGAYPWGEARFDPSESVRPSVRPT